MIEEDIPQDRLFDYAKKYWTRLAEFVENKNEIIDYLLRRAELQRNKVKHNGEYADLNKIYKQLFSEFVINSYHLITEKLEHAPSSRCVFLVPEEKDTLEEILKETDIEQTAQKSWQFIPDTPEKYIKSINDIVNQISTAEEWTKNVYVSKTTAQRYIGKVDDGTIFLTEKRIMEIYFKSFLNINVRIIAEKHFPEGPLLYYVDIFQDKKQINKDRQKQQFLTEAALDNFVEYQQRAFDREYSQKEETDKKDE